MISSYFSMNSMDLCINLSWLCSISQYIPIYGTLTASDVAIPKNPQYNIHHYIQK